NPRSTFRGTARKDAGTHRPRVSERERYLPRARPTREPTRQLAARPRHHGGRARRHLSRTFGGDNRRAFWSAEGRWVLCAVRHRTPARTSGFHARRHSDSTRPDAG